MHRNENVMKNKLDELSSTDFFIDVPPDIVNDFFFRKSTKRDNYRNNISSKAIQSWQHQLSTFAFNNELFLLSQSSA